MAQKTRKYFVIHPRKWEFCEMMLILKSLNKKPYTYKKQQLFVMSFISLFPQRENFNKIETHIKFVGAFLESDTHIT